MKYAPPIEREIAALTDQIEADEQLCRLYPPRWLAIQLLEGDLTLLNGGKPRTKVMETLHASQARLIKEYGPDLDITLPDGCQDDEFLQTVEWGIQDAHLRSNPDWAVYIAGADPFSGDRLGRMDVTKDGLASRDEIVLSHCLDWRLPVAIVMGGGYARQIEDAVDIHMQTIRIAQQFSRQW